MADNRTVEQRLAAVAASMTMAGYTMTEADQEESRRILRGEVSADESVHQVLADASRDATDLVGKTAFRRIEQSPPSATDREVALRTVAGHWGELTIIHPFLDGNSRTQRYFFDHMLCHAGWSLDWRRIAAAEVHAARYVAAATLDSSLLVDALRPGLSTGEDCPQLPTEPAAVLFHRMMGSRRAHPHESFHKLFFADK